MVIKINDYYKDYVQHTRKNILKEDYSYSNPYLFVIFYIVMMICELLGLSKYYNVITNILFIVPLAIGTIIELYKVQKYNKNKDLQDEINDVLKLVFTRIFNIYLFTINSLLIFSGVILPNYKNYDFKLIISLIIIIPVGIILFIIGYKIGKYELKVQKKLKYGPVVIPSGIILGGTIIVKRSGYTFIFILLILLWIALPIALGKMYYMNKTYDKIVFPDDKLIDYNF